MIYNKCIYGCIYVLTVYFPDVHYIFCIDSILNLSTRRIWFRSFIIPYVKESTHTTMRSSCCSHHISDNSNFIHQLQIKHWQFYTSNSMIHSWHLTQNMTPVTRAYRPATMDQIILVAHLHHNMLMNSVLYIAKFVQPQCKLYLYKSVVGMHFLSSLKQLPHSTGYCYPGFIPNF